MKISNLTTQTSLSTYLKNNLCDEHQDQLNSILNDICLACLKISGLLRMGTLDQNGGYVDQQNIHGETQKKMDLIANDIFLDECSKNIYISGLGSEELNDICFNTSRNPNTDNYTVFFDPLDGSSNVDLNGTVGTIFSIFKNHSNTNIKESFLQPGVNQLCAGYAIYGTSVMLVFTTGNGVNGFTLNESNKEFYLTHPNFNIPANTNKFFINMSNYRLWDEPLKKYIDECVQGKDGIRGKDFNMRWSASMVAEIHRILLEGGIFIYPSDKRDQMQHGKIRLMYEANPMGFIIEQAGGHATNGLQRVLELSPNALHQKTPVFMGSADETERIKALYHAE